MSLKGYLSPNGRGFPQRHDTSVTTTLQAEGEKIWRFSRLPLEDFPLTNSPFPLSPAAIENLESVGYEPVKLTPGDALCLPAGMIHWAEAEGLSLALNLSFEYVNCGISISLPRKSSTALLNPAQHRLGMVVSLWHRLTNPALAKRVGVKVSNSEQNHIRCRAFEIHDANVILEAG